MSSSTYEIWSAYCSIDFISYFILSTKKSHTCMSENICLFHRPRLEEWFLKPYFSVPYNSVVRNSRLLDIQSDSFRVDDAFLGVIVQWPRSKDQAIVMEPFTATIAANRILICVTDERRGIKWDSDNECYVCEYIRNRRKHIFSPTISVKAIVQSCSPMEKNNVFFFYF